MINLGPAFETAVAKTLGIDADTIDPGSLQIDLINPDGAPTMLRFTIHFTIDTPTLQKLMTSALPVQTASSIPKGSQ